MCLLAILYRVVEDAPLVVGANREELYSRGGDPPAVIDGRAVAGLDPTAGGTWLGLNAHGVVVAVTNRVKSNLPRRPRSRGLLTRDLLACPTAVEAAETAARELGQDRYAGCNIACLDTETAVVVQAGDWLRVRPLPPGCHVLTNRDVNDASDPRLAHALEWLGRQRYGCSSHCITALEALCAQDGEDGGTPICYRGDEKGTVSSSIIAVRRPPASSIYLHAQGPPGRTPYQDYSHLLREPTA
jgi:hypothetical protein